MREDGQPSWPEGIVGSITHTDDYCAAVVARKNHCNAIGLDAESMEGITPDLYPYICTAEEHDRLRAMEFGMRAKAAALIFSAKEAFYKCQFPLTAEFLDFQDIQLDVCGLAFGEGRCSLLPARAITLEEHFAPPYEGRFCINHDLILSGFQFSSGANFGGFDHA